LSTRITSLPIDVQRQIAQMGTLLRDCLGDDIAVVLHGSLALGEFRPGQSDVDVLVFVDGPLTRVQAQGLATGFLAVSGQPAPIEVSVLERGALAAWVHPAPYLFHYSEDWRDRTIQMLADPATDWLAVHTDPDLTVHVVVARQAGIVLHGAVDWPVPSRADALAAVWYDIATAAADVADNPVYVILNLCRTIWWLEHGVVLSKSAGGAALLPSLSGDAQAVVAAVLAARATGQAVTVEPMRLQTVAGALMARVCRWRRD
jgi:predicted nucleotidyltransferase